MAVLRTGLALDALYERHETGDGHPERPERLRAIRQAFVTAGLVAQCAPLALRAASESELQAVHDEVYLQRIAQHCATGARYIDCIDSTICPQSFEIARYSAGAAVAAVDAVMDNTLTNAFCAVRPPGHHAERGLSMGFCLLNNVAIAAQHLLDRHGLHRIAIVDWDVHHGNGTQHAFEETDAVFVCNLHGHPAYVYPGTGFAQERGRHAGEGATLNIPLYPGAGDDDYRRAFDEQVLPALEQYRPEFILISAGFDAHRQDPLAPLNLESASFAWMTRAMIHVAKQYASCRLVSILEGGYNLTALAESSSAHLRELLVAGGRQEE